ncbi:MAG: hypothetical protein CL605_06570 [Altibacter sp.]|nr:hypothetical protein [Altibacter sp.]
MNINNTGIFYEYPNNKLLIKKSRQEAFFLLEHEQLKTKELLASMVFLQFFCILTSGQCATCHKQ